MVSCYVSDTEEGEEGQMFPGLGQYTLTTITSAVQLELRDVGKLVDDWNHEQWKKENGEAASKDTDA